MGARREEGRGFALQQPLAGCYVENTDGREEWNPSNEFANRLAQVLLHRRFGQQPYWVAQGWAWFVEMRLFDAVYCFPYRDEFVGVGEHTDWDVELENRFERRKKRDYLKPDEFVTWRRGKYIDSSAKLAWGVVDYLAQRHVKKVPALLEELRAFYDADNRVVTGDTTWSRDLSYEIPLEHQQRILEKHLGKGFWKSVSRHFVTQAEAVRRGRLSMGLFAFIAASCSEGSGVTLEPSAEEPPLQSVREPEVAQVARLAEELLSALDSQEGLREAITVALKDRDLAVPLVGSDEPGALASLQETVEAAVLQAVGNSGFLGPVSEPTSSSSFQAITVVVHRRETPRFKRAPMRIRLWLCSSRMAAEALLCAQLGRAYKAYESAREYVLRPCFPASPARWASFLVDGDVYSAHAYVGMSYQPMEGDGFDRNDRILQIHGTLVVMVETRHYLPVEMPDGRTLWRRVGLGGEYRSRAIELARHVADACMEWGSQR